MSAQRHILLGLFFVVVIGTLSWFTLFKTDFSLLGERHGMTVHFSQAGGLREGDNVLVAGMRWGTIEGMTFTPTAPIDERVTVELSLEQPIELYDDQVIRIEDATVLGGKQLVIEPGLPRAGSWSGGTLHGTVAPNVMKSLADVVEENREALNSVMTGLKELVGRAQAGEGVLGKLLDDDELADNLSKAVESISATFENAQILTADLREGEGTIGKLLKDTELYGKIQDIADNLDATLSEARAIVEGARAGQGTVGAFLNDEELARDVREAIDSIASISSGLAEGRGTLGHLLVEDEVYESVRTITDNLAELTTSLREGEGTIGKLLKDDELYAELERAVRTLTGSLEEAREAAPISTFLNTVFLGF